MSILELNGIAMRYPGAAAPCIQGLELTVEKGEIVTLLGESGCGKTTLLKLVAGLETPAAGTLRIAGKEALRASLALCRKLHMDVRDVCVSAGEEESGFTAALELQGREELSSLMEKLGSIPGVGSVKGEEKHDAV